MTLDDAAGVAARDSHAGEASTGAGGSHDVPRQSLLKRPFPGLSEPSSPAMCAQSSASTPSAPPVGTQGLKRSAEVELVDLEQEIEQTGPPRPRMLENLFWCSDVSSGVCMSEHVTRPEIHDETICSIKFSDGHSVKGGSERKKLGGSEVLVWKLQGGIDDSTFEELPGDQVFAGMREEIANLEKCKTGKIIGHPEVQRVKEQHPKMRLIPARWAWARKTESKVRSRIVAKDLAHGSARNPSHDACMLLW